MSKIKISKFDKADVHYIQTVRNNTLVTSSVLHTEHYNEIRDKAKQEERERIFEILDGLFDVDENGVLSHYDYFLVKKEELKSKRGDVDG